MLIVLVTYYLGLSEKAYCMHTCFSDSDTSTKIPKFRIIIDLSPNILLKSFVLLTLISLYFKIPIPVKSRKMIRSDSNFQRLFSVPITRPVVFRDYAFLLKKHILTRNAK